MKVMQHHNTLLILLDDEAIERIRRYDPAQLSLTDYALPDVQIGITFANADDVAIITDMMKKGKVREAFKHATRGFECRSGDHDMGPVSLLRPPKVDA